MASVLSGGWIQTSPQATALEGPAGSEPNQSRDVAQAVLPTAGETPEPGETAQFTAPEPDDLASMDGAVMDSAVQPETGAADDTLIASQAGEGLGGVKVASESPVLPSPQAIALAKPDSEDSLSMSSDPAQPAVPDLAADGAVFPEDEVAAIASTGETAQTVAPQNAEEDPSEDAAVE